MIITKKTLPRRTFLRGLGTTIALPLLDGMIPAMSAIVKTAAKPIPRLCALYVPNGMNMAKWTPAGEGGALELSQILSPLAPFRDKLLVLSNLCNKEADSQVGEGGGDHSRAQAAFLTGAHAKKAQSDVYLGVSMDQIAAKQFGRETQLASLELSLESNDLVGGCEFGLSCAYGGTLAWSSATNPLPMESNPRAVFERLFGAGDSTDSRARMSRLKKNRSILDMVTDELTQLQTGLGPSDRSKLTEYVEAVRDIERRLQRAEQQSDQELPEVLQPAGVPTSYEEYTKLMFDLLALSFQTDMTRVSTFLVGREQSGRTFPEVGVAEAWHPVSHHGYDPQQLEKQAKINQLNIKLLGHLLEKLRTTQDGDGTLLDHSVIIYGAGMSDSNVHNHHEVPVLVAGGGAGTIKGGRHLKYPKETPLANLHVTVLDKIGVPVETVGNSTGKLDALSGV
jgi:hypothetical protein